MPCAPNSALKLTSRAYARATFGAKPKARDNATIRALRQYVTVMRGRFATWEFLVLDLDIMVKVVLHRHCSV